MRLRTRHFDIIEFMEESIIKFPEGLLGFEDLRSYIIIKNDNPEVPFDWLQSIENPDLAFVITDPFLFLGNYEFELGDKDVEELKINTKNDIKIYNIVVVGKDIKESTMNLRGPIIINIQEKIGKQIVLDTDKYSLKHELFK